MSRTITIVTPENIPVTYQVAGFASRFIALLIDLTIQLLAIGLVTLLARLLSGAFQLVGTTLAGLVSAVGILLVYLLFFAYATFFELLWGGRTPGKRLMGLRVIRDGGYPITFFASALRNILRFVDFGLFPISSTPLALFGLPGLITLFVSPTYKRLGDYAAGTLVIVETGATPLNLERRSAELAPGVAAALPLIRNLDRMTPEEYRIVRRFAARRNELDPVVMPVLAEQLARPLMQKLEIVLPIANRLQYADLLEALEYRYAEEYGVL